MDILGTEKIREYLFDNDFDVTGIYVCTDYIPNSDTCNDCCIGNNQQILDALLFNKHSKNCFKDILDLMDAFFRVLSWMLYPSCLSCLGVLLNMD